MTIYDAIETAARDLYIRGAKRHPARCPRRLSPGSHQRARRRRLDRGASDVHRILENIDTADSQSTLVCQDTGLPVFKVTIGLPVDVPELEQRLRKGCERATAEYPLRSNTVHPLTRKHTGTNTGHGIPVIKLAFSNSNQIEIVMAPKGSGLEYELSQDAGSRGRPQRREEIRPAMHLRFRRAPLSSDDRRYRHRRTSDLAMQLAKDASTFRHIGTSNPDSDVAALERELLDQINQTGIGPQGLGGATTALAVHVEWAHTHISQNPVAVNIQCWRGERASAIISAKGIIAYAS